MSYFKLLLLLSVPCCIASADVSFHHIEPLAGQDRIYIYGVSGNGQVAVGESRGALVKWTLANGTVGLGSPSSGFASHDQGGKDANYDGSIIVGNYNYGAFRWVEGDGFTVFPETVDGRYASGDWLPMLTYESGNSGDFSNLAYSISSDGSLIAGIDEPTGWNEVVRWSNQGAEVTTTPDLNGHTKALGTDSGFSEGYGISPDGSVIVGTSESPNATSYEAMIWVYGEAMQGIGGLKPNDINSVAYATSDYGQVVVGKSESVTSYDEAFVWTESGGMLGLHAAINQVVAYGNYLESRATDVTRDGSLVLGSSYGSPVNGTDDWSMVFIYDVQKATIVSLEAYLESQGIDLEGWDLREATAISDDGSVIVGHGYYNNERHSWMIRDFEFPVDPSISLSQASAATLSIEFTGTLEQTEDLNESWTPLEPQPTSPYTVPVDNDSLFFRATD